MTINVRTKGDITILDLQGNLGLGESVATFRNQIQELVSAGVKKVAVNLAGVMFVDSSGIGSMVGAHTALESTGGQCKFFAAQPRVIRTLDLTHMSEVFDMHDGEAATLASFASSPQGSGS